MDHFLGLKPMFFSYVNSLEGSFCLQAPLFSCASPVIAVRLWVCYSWETNSSSFFLVVNPLWNNMSACLAIRFFFSSCGCSIKTYQNSPCHLIHLAFQLSLWPICWFWAGFCWVQTEKNGRTFGHWNIERQGQTTTKRTKAKCCAGCAVVLFLWVFVWESPLFGWQPGTLGIERAFHFKIVSKNGPRCGWGPITTKPDKHYQPLAPTSFGRA